MDLLAEATWIAVVKLKLIWCTVTLQFKDFMFKHVLRKLYYFSDNKDDDIQQFYKIVWCVLYWKPFSFAVYSYLRDAYNQGLL